MGSESDWLQKLSAALGLTPSVQDWGIVNSDPDRLEEFLDFYGGNVVEHPWEPEAMAELILQSANDALERGALSRHLQERIIRFVRQRGHEFPNTLSYWLSLYDNSEFPVAKLIVGST